LTLEAALRVRRSAPRLELSLSANLALPVVRFAWSQLAGAVRENTAVSLSPLARRALRQSLLVRLSTLANGVAEWEWQAFRTTPGLFFSRHAAGPPKAEFFSGTVEEQTRHLLGDYPELARLWRLQVRTWLGFIGKFLQETAQFAALRGDGNPRVQSLRFHQSDPHPGGGSTIEVVFADGARWFYKPRSGRWESEWFALLERINEFGFQLPFATPPVVLEADHCWMGSISWRPCRNSREARRFYLRAGALLYLLHQLRGVDFHAGNLIAHGEQPVFIDCETLLHGASPMPARARARERSVFRTGMLAIPLIDRTGHDVSALTGEIPALHRPKLRGHLLRASDFAAEVTTGFALMHAFLQVPRRWDAVFCEARLRQDQARTRAINRPTAHYRALLERSLSAQCLRNSVLRRSYLTEACRRNGGFGQVIADEVDAMMDGYVPLLWARAGRVRPPPSERAFRGALALIAKALGSPGGWNIRDRERSLSFQVDA